MDICVLNEKMCDKSIAHKINACYYMKYQVESTKVKEMYLWEKLKNWDTM